MENSERDGNTRPPDLPLEKFVCLFVCFLRNLYASQETTVRTGHGKTDWFQIGKGVRQGCILSPCLFNLNAEYITRNAGLEETQAGIDCRETQEHAEPWLPGALILEEPEARIELNSNLKLKLKAHTHTHTQKKIAGRNINNLRYADGTTLMEEREEELKSLLMKVKEEREKDGFKTKHSKNKDHSIQSHHFMANRWGNNGNSERLYFGGLQNHCRW